MGNRLPHSSAKIISVQVFDNSFHKTRQAVWNKYFYKYTHHLKFVHGAVKTIYSIDFVPVAPQSVFSRETLQP